MSTYQTHLSEEEEPCQAPCMPVVCNGCPFGEVGDDPTEEDNGFKLKVEH